MEENGDEVDINLHSTYHFTCQNRGRKGIETMTFYFIFYYSCHLTIPQLSMKKKKESMKDLRLVSAILSMSSFEEYLN